MTCVFASSLAQAQSERELLQQARTEMERGQELYLQENWTEAAAAFLSAYEARPFSAFLFNAGIAFERNGDATQAIDHYNRYLEAEPDASDAEEVRERITRLQAALDEARAQAADPDGDPDANPDGNPDGDPDANPDGNPDANPDGDPDGQPNAVPERVIVEGPPQPMKSLLSVETVQEGATITVKQGNRTIGEGSSPFAHTLDEGQYEITASHPDYRTSTQTVEVRAGKVYVFVFDMSQGEFLGYLRVVSDPPGASIFIDDREEGAYGTTPFANDIATGTHHIWIERPGYATEERDVEIVIGADVTQQVSLTRVTFGRLRVVGNIPGSKVLVDGEEVGEVPYEGEVEGGTHRVTVRENGMKDWEEEVEIHRGQLTPIRVRLRPAPTRGGGIATATLAVLFIAGGVATRLMANNRLSQLEEDRDAGVLSSEDGRRDFGFGLSIASLASFGVGGILGLLSIYYMFKDGLPDSEGNVLEPRDWTATPVLDPVNRAAGVDMEWRF